MRAEIVKYLATTLESEDALDPQATVQRCQEGRCRLGQDSADPNDRQAEHRSDPGRDAESELDTYPVGCEVACRNEVNDRQESHDREEFCEREADGDACDGEE